MTVSCTPSADTQPVGHACAACVTPGTAAMARAAAGGTVKSGKPGRPEIVASAPAAFHDAATSPLVTASRTMPANAATVSASTRANAGSAGVSALRVARARPRNAVAPADLAKTRSSPRRTNG